MATLWLAARCGAMEHSLQDDPSQDNPKFADRLKALGADLVRWRAEADRLRTIADAALDSRHVEEEALVNVEQSAGMLYAEIETFDALLRDVASKSPAAASELATVDDALRLLLLDVTELGTRLYSIRSMNTPALPDMSPDN
jgi:hypothetical protein